MLLTFNLAVWRENEEAVLRKTRRLAYMAAIAQAEGHKVIVHVPDCANPEFARPLYFDFVRDAINPLDIIYCSGHQVLDHVPNVAAYFCSHATPIVQPRDAVPPHGKIPRVYFKESLSCEHDPYLALTGAVIVSYVWRPKDFASDRKREWFETARQHQAKIADKILSVPWLPHERVLAQLHKDGLWRAFIADDLKTIRTRYSTGKTERYGGFVGKPWPVRKELAARLGPRFEFVWAGHGLPQMAPDEYLRWMSECRLCLGLPGDTWKCSRFLEAVMMGVPCVQRADTINIEPPLTGRNCVLVREFDDHATIHAAMKDAGQIVRQATADYKAGWSLRAQFREIMRRVQRARAKGRAR